MTIKVYLKDVAYEKIKKLLIMGELEGRVISENELVKTLEMSRTPIREALQRLQNEGFLEIIPKRGVYIKEITLKEASDLMHVRVAIEVYSMERIPELVTDQHIADLKSNIELQKAAIEQHDVYKFLQLDLEYHEYFLKIYDNHHFVGTLNNISDRLIQHGMKVFNREPFRLLKSVKEHEEINHHLEQRNFKEAITALENHILGGRDYYFR
ncbi:GntR family transcriptional regulator [Sporosarcina contaminans]|uniref:GntR family transcriptional regulator n=1 Tax=Sporosarcina contaminans TaxID=633403 RepID=A0ABW3U066_9BACL